MPLDDLCIQSDVAASVDREDHRRETMTAADYAVAQFLDSLTVPENTEKWLDFLADGDAATTNPDVSFVRQNTFI